MESNDKKPGIKNGLNKDFNAFFRYPVEENRTDGEEVITRGVGHKNDRGKHKSLVNKKKGEKPGCLEFDRSDLPNEYLLLIKIDNTSTNSEINRLRVIPGSVLGYAHHTECHITEEYYLIIIKYNKGKNSGIDHIDPKVEHPDPPVEIPEEN